MAAEKTKIGAKRAYDILSERGGKVDVAYVFLDLAVRKRYDASMPWIDLKHDEQLDAITYISKHGKKYAKYVNAKLKEYVGEMDSLKAGGADAGIINGKMREASEKISAAICGAVCSPADAQTLAGLGYDIVDVLPSNLLVPHESQCSISYVTLSEVLEGQKAMLRKTVSKARKMVRLIDKEKLDKRNRAKLFELPVVWSSIERD